MKRSTLNHVWLGLEVNGQKVTEIAYERPYTYVTLESGEVLKNLATTSWKREEGKKKLPPGRFARRVNK